MRRVRSATVDRCGCAMGAKFLLAALVASTLWYWWCWDQAGLTLGRAALRIASLSFCASIAGKLVGLAMAKLRPAARRSP